MTINKSIKIVNANKNKPYSFNSKPQRKNKNKYIHEKSVNSALQYNSALSKDIINIKTLTWQEIKENILQQNAECPLFSVKEQVKKPFIDKTNNNNTDIELKADKSGQKQTKTGRHIKNDVELSKEIEKKGASKDILTSYCKAINRQIGTVDNLRRDNKQNLIAINSKGSAYYNKRQYAKHKQLLDLYKEHFSYCYAYTQTLGEEYREIESPKKERQFIKDVCGAMRKVCRKYKGKYLICFQYTRDLQIHAHIMIFTQKPIAEEPKNKDNRFIDTQAKRNIDIIAKVSGETYCEFIANENIDKTFNYIHSYTKYSSSDYTNNDTAQNRQEREKIEKAITDIFMSELRKTPCFISSGTKGGGIKPQSVEKSSPKAQQNAIASDFPPDITKALKDIERVEKENRIHTKEELKSLKLLFEYSFPCVLQCKPKNDTAQNQRLTKIQQMRKNAEKRKETQYCKGCFIIGLYESICKGIQED